MSNTGTKKCFKFRLPSPDIFSRQLLWGWLETQTTTVSLGVTYSKSFPWHFEHTMKKLGWVQFFYCIQIEDIVFIFENIYIHKYIYYKNVEKSSNINRRRVVFYADFIILQVCVDCWFYKYKLIVDIFTHVWLLTLRRWQHFLRKQIKGDIYK